MKPLQPCLNIFCTKITHHLSSPYDGTLIKYMENFYIRGFRRDFHKNHQVRVRFLTYRKYFYVKYTYWESKIKRTPNQWNVSIHRKIISPYETNFTKSLRQKGYLLVENLRIPITELKSEIRKPNHYDVY